LTLTVNPRRTLIGRKAASFAIVLPLRIIDIVNRAPIRQHASAQYVEISYRTVIHELLGTEMNEAPTTGMRKRKGRPLIQVLEMMQGTVDNSPTKQDWAPTHRV
jgi:hypothetical protein